MILEVTITIVLLQALQYFSGSFVHGEIAVHEQLEFLHVCVLSYNMSHPLH